MLWVIKRTILMHQNDGYENNDALLENTKTGFVALRPIYHYGRFSRLSSALQQKSRNKNLEKSSEKVGIIGKKVGLFNVQNSLQ